MPVQSGVILPVRAERAVFEGAGVRRACDNERRSPCGGLMLGRLGESPIMGNRGLQINPVGVLASCGLGLNLVWCTLMGHTLGFMSSTAGMDAWANPRLFFLAGILLCTAAFATAPRALKRADGMLRFVLPLLSAFGTACFGMSFHQTFFDPGALAVGGLFVAGVGYFWLAARYMLLLGARRATCAPSPA